MGITAKVTPDGGSDITFAQISTSTGRHALTMSVGSPGYLYNAYHVPGTQGDIVANLGSSVTTIMLTALYNGIFQNAVGQYEEDKIAMGGKVLTIVDHVGNYHMRCRLTDSRESAPIKGYFQGDIGLESKAYCFFTVNYTFERHGLQGNQGSQGYQSG